ncbi:MAG: hypothetical protein NTW29_13715 [Bacteroidetes bacterium]|nr:hypothetical protein [Bacteroidota bacterium]
MKQVKLIFLYIFLYAYAAGQSYVLSGAVFTKDKIKLPAATITLQKKNDSAILAFGIADENGHFEFSYNYPDKDTLEVKASMLGYATQQYYFVAGDKKVFEFVLLPAAITLPEVKTTNKPIWQRKDTINYSAAAFKQQQDRVIGDIIARLPGMEITASGQIKYQGKPINKFYIEGLDLLEDKYSLANNNIPAGAVDRIQVLENHQPIRLLDSLSFSDKAALNITLKNSARAHLIGQARIGFGAEPLLSENELVAMLFKRKSQYINTYKFNNTGVDNTRDFISHNRMDYSNSIESGGMKNDIVTLVEPGPPPIQKGRYLFNNAHTTSLNLLVPIDSIYQLRINSFYVNDYQRFDNSISSRFFLPDDTIAFFEETDNRKGMNQLKTDISVLANSPKFYLKNATHLEGWWQHDKGLVFNNGTGIGQRIASQFFHISNDFKVIKARKLNVWEWASYLGYSIMPQELLVYPGLYKDVIGNGSPYDALLQKAKMRIFYGDNSVSIRNRRGKVNTYLRIGSNWQNKLLHSRLFTSLADVINNASDSFSNNLKWDRVRFYTETGITFEKGILRLSAALPVSYTMIRYKNGMDPQVPNNGFVFSPNISTMLQLSANWVLGNNISYSNLNFGEAEQVATGYILKTYRNFTANNSPLSEQSYLSVSSYVNYRDPLKSVFFSGGINYQKNIMNVIYEQLFNRSLETVLANVLNNKNSSFSFFARINKYALTLKTSFTANAGYSINKAQQLQQGLFADFTNRSITLGIGLNSKLSSKVTMEYAATGYKYLSNSAGKSSRPPVYSANQQISINIFPARLWVIRLAGEHYYLKTQFTGKEQNYFFADFNIRLKPQKAKIDWEMVLQNLFNTKKFVSAINSNNTEMISSYRLRPRQVLIKAGFRFK